MSTTSDKVAMEYPIPGYRFVVTVGNEKVAFNSVSGLDIDYDSMEYKDGTGNLYRMPGQRKSSTITLKKGVFRGKSSLYDWINSISLNRVEKKDIMISLTNETGSELLVSWQVINAFPTKLTAPSIDATTNDVAVQEITLEADRVAIITH